ncbi:hypothetical protein TELCIR_13682 [Teladorsagia circumcincta]|uniref:Receptor ligand binding region domain-containing protein n=1 Tax=Teladorsagia circumcincta TaxID=45464 RepID=A0A2G9U339_TELCI|nr:hypothetical protein TELCIR_13682 [Teladorsagia circumcincta]
MGSRLKFPFLENCRPSALTVTKVEPDDLKGFKVFVVNYTECSSETAVGVALEQMVKQNVDLVIGPPCPASAKMVGYLSTYYQKTMLGWGFLIDSIFSDEKRFKYLTKIMPDSLQMMYAMLDMFAMFQWNRVAIYYTPNQAQFCDTMTDDVVTAFSDDSLRYTVDVVQKVAFNGQDSDYLTEQLLRTKRIARIQTGDKNLITDAKSCTKFNFENVDINGDDVDPKMLKDFQAKVVARVRDDPLYCDTSACMSNDGKAASYVLDTNFNQVTAINFTITDGQSVMTKGYTNEATTLWATRGGQRPLARPKCGYTGTECPKPFWEQYGIYVIVAAAVIGVVLIAAIMFIVYVIRTRKKEQEQQRLLWQIPYMKLRKPPTSVRSFYKPSDEYSFEVLKANQND